MTTPTPPATHCGCCPRPSLIRCWTPQTPLSCASPGTLTPRDPQAVTPTGATVTANPLAWTLPNPLTRTYDGTTAADLGNWVIGCGFTTGDTQVAVRWSYTIPVDDVWSVSVWHGAGGDTSDGDGLSPGSTTLTVYGAANTVLFSGAATVAVNGSEQQTVFPSALDGVTGFEFSHMFKGPGAPDLYIREVRVNTQWKADISYSCPPYTMSAVVESDALTSSPGLTLTATNLDQTNGPHTLTWTVPPGVTGHVTTDHPENFSTLVITNGSTMVVSGDQANQFSIQWDVTDPNLASNRAFGYLCDGVITWYDAAGNVVPGNRVQDCPAS